MITFRSCHSCVNVLPHAFPMSITLMSPCTMSCNLSHSCSHVSPLISSAFEQDLSILRGILTDPWSWKSSLRLSLRDCLGMGVQVDGTAGGKLRAELPACPKSAHSQLPEHLGCWHPWDWVCTGDCHPSHVSTSCMRCLLSLTGIAGWLMSALCQGASKASPGALGMP